MVSEMVSRNDPIVMNRGQEMTFIRGTVGSIIDRTIAAPRLDSMIGDYFVLEVTRLTHHQCIEFNMQVQSHPVNTGRGGKGKRPC